MSLIRLASARPRPGFRPAAPAQPGGHPLLARRLATAQPTYETRLDREAPAYLADHVVDGAALLPATALVEMALHAGSDVLGLARARLDELVIRAPLPLDGGRVVQLTVSSDAADGGALRLFSRPAGDEAAAAPWVLHATARIRADEPRPEAVDGEARRRREALQAGARVVRDGDAHYERFRALGAEFGPAFRGVRRIWCGEGEALAEVELPSMLVAADPRARIHPALLDACVQVVAGAVDTDDATLLVPMAADSIRVVGDAARAWSHARLRVQGESVTADIEVTDDAGSLLAELRGLVFRRTARAAAPVVTAEPYRMPWSPCPAAAPNGTARAGRWLIVADRGGVADSAVTGLQARGHAVTLLRDGAAVPPPPAGGWTGVVYLRALDATGDGGELPATAVAATAEALALVQALDVTSPAPRLWLVTRGAQPVGRAGRRPRARSVPAVGARACRRARAPRAADDARGSRSGPRRERRRAGRRAARDRPRATGGVARRSPSRGAVDPG